MKKHDPKGVGDILEGMKESTALGRQLDQAAIWRRWPEIVGQELSPHGRPQTIKDNQLRIEVDSAVWMHKFSFHKWAIIKRINRMAGKELVSDIFLVLLEDGREIDDE